MKTSQLPVSRKFYSEINQRVNSSLSAINSTNAVIRTLEMIDQYLISGAEPQKNSPSDSLLVFFLLKPEIDKAIKRSNAARQRARLRHIAKAIPCEQEHTDITENKEIVSVENINSPSSETLSADAIDPQPNTLSDGPDSILPKDSTRPTQAEKSSKKRNKKRRKRHHKSPKAAMC